MRFRKSYAILLLLSGCACPTPGTGEKVGTIIKLSRTGIICKTWDAELIRGGFQNGSGAMGVAPFDFTLSASQADTVQALMEKGVEVKIRYSSEWVGLCTSETGHLLTGIEPVR